MSVNGTPESGATRVGLPVVDMVTGLNAALAIMLALHHRSATGRGQFVEATLFDSALGLLHPHAANYALSGRLPRLTGNDHPNISPYSVYRTATRPIYLAVGNDRQFARLCAQIGAEPLVNDLRFASNGGRVENRAALTEALERRLVEFDGAELADQLIRAGVPAGPVLNVEEALNHPHTRHRGMRVEIGDYQGLGAPSRLSETAATYRCEPPAFAQHSAEVLRSLGYAEEEIGALRDKGIAPDRPLVN